MGMSEKVMDGGAAYSRISHVKDADQTGVERRDKLSLKNAKRQGVTVLPEHQFVDPFRSAWQRNRKRPGWDALLEAIQGRRVSSVSVPTDPLP